MTRPVFAKGLRPGLYAITDSHLLPQGQLVAAVAAAIRGGAVLVQYREKNLGAAQRLGQAKALASLCRAEGVPLIINDDPRLAAESGAQGVHLGQSDATVAEARALLGKDAIIGITCHGRLELAEKAAHLGADYLAFGRFHESATKPGAPSASPEVLTRAGGLGLPRTAIGGITETNGEPLIRAGADLLAVVGGLFAGEANEIEARARTFTRLFAEHHPCFRPR
ncbi:thiamine-phosphate diphosphorylase [Marinobacter daqiaonensis]|uniref:Thiamine-phosphate synthase n=1 Tax=Marinobacter daqiaonensis TaxID=650891 RepID=A0A1I6JWS0_9GAMM|nr:thiamine phosphate synthase [Marinobacter daqiaonensis]SFR83407.1 thiamine-phosphate diphosphorylase [Marinobacter daqiaonensis]